MQRRRMKKNVIKGYERNIKEDNGPATEKGLPSPDSSQVIFGLPATSLVRMDLHVLRLREKGAPN